MAKKKKEKQQLPFEIPDDVLQQIDNDPELLYLQQYNTMLDSARQQQFMNWAVQRYGDPMTVMMEMGAYDLMGAWDAGDMDKADSTGHFTDRWKKPNHITFSEDSNYYDPETMVNGTWIKTPVGMTFIPTQQTLQLYGRGRLQEYFKKHEPGVRLLIFDR